MGIKVSDEGAVDEPTNTHHKKSNGKAKTTTNREKKHKITHADL